MSVDVFHPVEDFPNLPWDQLDPEQCTRAWSYGFGGNDLLPSQTTLCIPHEDGSADIWVMPDALTALIRMSREIGENSVRRDMRRVIGV